MSIVLDNMKACGVYLGGQAKEVYHGSDLVWRRSYPALLPGTLRMRFSDTTYDPSSAPAGTWSNLGWTLKRVSHEPNIWDFYHPTNLPNDALRPMANVSGATIPVTANFTIDEVVPHSSWANYIGLFSEHHYLVRCAEFALASQAVTPASSNATAYMFYNCSRLGNDIEWARHIYQLRQVFPANSGSDARGNRVYATPHASSIPIAFGGTKGRTRVVSKTGTGPFDETFSVNLRPGDWVYIACRGYSGSNKSGAYIHVRTSGNEIARDISNYDSTRILRVAATGSTGDKATGQFVCRWGYPPGTVMTCGSSRRIAYSSNSPYANVYVDSYQFL